MNTQLPKNAKYINKYLVKVESDHKKVYLNGKEIYMDNTYNDLQNAQSIATVISEPINPKDRDKNITVGDEVLIHHFVTRQGKKINIEGEDSIYYLATKDMIYMAIHDGEYKSVGPFCILRKEDPTEVISASGIYTGEINTHEENEGIVIAACDEFDGNIGDKVLFDKGVDYDMALGAETVYRVRCSSIYAIVYG